MQIVWGVTRMVILTKSLAIKLPSPISWRQFLMGLLANMHEVLWYSTKHRLLCPIKFSLPGGWLLVMPRCQSVSEAEINYEDFKGLPVDHKPENFGKYSGRVVLVDYGN
jgi:hypothetical protein